MRSVSKVLVLAALGGLPAAAARAQDAFPLASHPVLQSLLAEALEKSPDLRSAEAGVAAARARIPQAGAAPDPLISLEYTNGGRGLALGSTDDTALGMRVSQELPFSGKRSLMEQVERRETARAASGVERVRRELVYRVRKAWADLLLARENLAVIDEQGRSLQDMEELTRSRYAVGLASQADVLRPQAELARLDQMRAHELGNEKLALAELNRLLARPAGTPLAPDPRLRDLAERGLAVPPLEAVLARAEGESADLAEARLEVERARSALELARRLTKPDFMAGGSLAWRGSEMPAMWSLELGVVAPLWASRKQKQAVAEAEARLAGAEALLEATRLRVRATAERNHAEFEAAVREADAYASGVLVIGGLAVESALASYRTGRVPFVSVLEAHGTRYRDRWEYANLLFHVLWHSAALDQLAAE